MSGAAAAVAVLLPCGQAQAGCVTLAQGSLLAYDCNWGSAGATLSFCGCKINVDCEGEVTCDWTYDKTFYADAGRCEQLSGVMTFNCGTECNVGSPCPPNTWQKVVLNWITCPVEEPCFGCIV